VPARSVETPVAKSPRDATAREPPRSVMQARVPPWRMLRRFWWMLEILQRLGGWEVGVQCAPFGCPVRSSLSLVLRL